MDIDPLESVEAAEEAAAAQAASEGARNNTLNRWVAVTVAVLSTFMGICKVKDDNVVQAMQQAQADKIDHWAYYQARNIRQQVAEATALQLQLAQAGLPEARQAEYAKAIAQYQAVAADQAKKKELLRQQAELDQTQYDQLNFHDDQFDLSDASLAIAISMLAVTALTRQRWLFWLTMVPTGFGLVMGVAGLVGGTLHPDGLVRLLS